MNKNTDLDAKLLISKAEDAAGRALKTGEPCFLPFLSDAQQFFVGKNTVFPHDDEKLVFFGGYADCDYKCAGFFPSYLFYDEDFDPERLFPVRVIHAKGSGFRKLNHRDFLGSIMALGLKREVIGDIVVSDDCFSAYIFCLDKTAEFLTTSFTNAANDRVICREIDFSQVYVPPRKFKEINTTVNSPRIDAVLCACLNISRDEADKMISSGLVSVNHSVCCDKSKMCSEGVTVSVRHHGRFTLKSIGDRNRRDRLRIVLHHYI